MPLATLTELKNRLGLGECADATQDAVLQLLLDLVEELILRRTGFSIAGPVGQVETHTNVQLGVTRVMKLRPIVPLSSDPLKPVILKARSLASNTFMDIIGDLVIPFEGRILPLASELTPVFPPIGGISPWFRWRQMIWPVVQFTYNIQLLGDGTGGTLATPKALKTAAIEWAAFIWSRPGGGSTSTMSVEKISETYVEASEPTLVRALLAPFTREMARMQF